MITFTINGRTLEVEEGTTVLEAALAAGVEIPTLCYHKELTPGGTCRLCMVEITGGGRPGLQAACLYKATEGLVIETNSERVQKSRKIVLEILLARCPDSVPIKEIAAKYGVTETRITLKDQDNCLLCGLCVRACAEISQRKAISFAFRGRDRTVQTPFSKLSDVCIGCGACAYLCPTGRIKIEEAD